MVARTAPTKITPRNTRQATPHRMSPCLACQRTYSRRVTMNGTIARTQRYEKISMTLSSSFRSSGETWASSAVSGSSVIGEELPGAGSLRAEHRRRCLIMAGPANVKERHGHAHADAPAVPVDQGAAPRRHPPVPPRRFLRDVLRRRRPGLEGSFTDPDFARPRHEERGADVRRAVPRRRVVRGASHPAGAQGRHLRPGG